MLLISGETFNARRVETGEKRTSNILQRQLIEIERERDAAQVEYEKAENDIFSLIRYL